jgi:hypothetical protein
MSMLQDSLPNLSLCTSCCALMQSVVRNIAPTPNDTRSIPTLMQVAAVRLVSGVFGRITGAAIAQEEVALLQNRVHHLYGMKITMRSPPELQLRGADAHNGSQRQLVHAGLAVGCAALGLAGAYLMIRRSR